MNRLFMGKLCTQQPLTLTSAHGTIKATFLPFPSMFIPRLFNDNRETAELVAVPVKRKKIITWLPCPECGKNISTETKQRIGSCLPCFHKYD